MATKSIQRSLELIKNKGWNYWITEKWNPYSRTREDMFNFIDILCYTGKRTIAIQACGSDYQAHRRKIEGNEWVREWLDPESNRSLQVWSWRRLLKKRGGKAKYWKARIIDVYTINEKELYWEER